MAKPWPSPAEPPRGARRGPGWRAACASAYCERAASSSPGRLQRSALGESPGPLDPGLGLAPVVLPCETLQVPEEDLPHLFDRFFKSDRSRAQGGSGLGLAIAQENARIQGRRIEVANRPEGGARSTLWLPAADPELTGDEGADDEAADDPGDDDRPVAPEGRAGRAHPPSIR